MPKHSSTTNPAITAEHIRVRFGATTVIDDVSFTVPEGSIAALIGPNGSGKTTLMRAILGLQNYQHGTIEVLGGSVQDVYGDIGYVPQSFQPDPTIPMTVREFLDIARRKQTPVHRIREVLEEVGLNPVSIQASQAATLSGGQRQRVLIARAILNHPRILFLDEPSTGIDIAGEQTVFELLAELNRSHQMTMLMISHEVHMVAKHVDHVLCLNTSLVCAGPPSKALNDSTLHAMYGSDYTDGHEHTHV